MGSCVNSFDEDGDCVVNDLPWSTVSDLGYADENAVDVGEHAFSTKVEIPSGIMGATAGHDIHYLEHEDVYMLYDSDDDIHYFFV